MKSLPSKWIKMATSKQVSNGSDPDSDCLKDMDFNSGDLGLTLIEGMELWDNFTVIPEHNTIVAITSGTDNMGGVMQIVWEELLPKMNSSEMISNPEGIEILRKKSASLKLKPVNGKMSKRLAKKFFDKKIELAENDESVEFIFFNDKKNEVEIKINDKIETIPFGFGEYIKSELKVIYLLQVLIIK